MKSPGPGDAGDLPFDRPLDPQPASGGFTAQQTQPELPLEPFPALPPDQPGVPTAVGIGDEPPEPPELTRATHRRRLAAAIMDLTAHLAVLASAVVGSSWLGVPLDRFSVFPLAVFTACFSLVYYVLPLTFWGQTPGMAGSGLVARSLDGGPLTISQSVRRWLGAALNVVTLGLFLLVFRRPSLSDRLSRSKVQA